MDGRAFRVVDREWLAVMGSGGGVAFGFGRQGLCLEMPFEVTGADSLAPRLPGLAGESAGRRAVEDADIGVTYLRGWPLLDA